MEYVKAIVSATHTPAAVTYVYKDIKTGREIQQPDISAVEYSVVLESLKNISGKMLTFIEASTLDKEQRKAAKDIVKGFFSEEMSNMSEICFSYEYLSPNIGITVSDEELEKMSVDIEDVIKGNI